MQKPPINFKSIATLSLILFFSPKVIAQVGKTLVLNGCTDYFEVTHNSSLNFSQVQSIECWVKPNCDDGNRIILGKQWCRGQFGYYLSIRDEKLLWAYSLDGFCNDPNLYETLTAKVPTNRFTHVAVVHTTNSVSLFINGDEVSSQRLSGRNGNIFNNSEPIRIGVYQGISRNIGNYFSGQLDELRIWNTALTESLIKSRMNGTLSGNEVGLVAYFDMENTGKGSSLELTNRSTSGTLLNARVLGNTAQTPYISDPVLYEMNPMELGDDTSLCSDYLDLVISNSGFKEFTWNNGSTGSSLRVSGSGSYSVVGERELCKFFHDTIEVNFGGGQHIFRSTQSVRETL